MPLYEMMVMAARMAMMTMTINSSTRVKAEEAEGEEVERRGILFLFTLREKRG